MPAKTTTKTKTTKAKSAKPSTLKTKAKKPPTKPKKLIRDHPKHDLIPEHFLDGVQKSAKSFDIVANSIVKSPPLIKLDKNKIPISRDPYEKIPDTSKILTHKTQDIAGLKPIEIPDLESIVTAAPKTKPRPDITGVNPWTQPKPAEADPFEEVLEELAHNEYLQGSGPSPEDLTIGQADRIYKTLASNEPADSDDVIDLDEPDEVSKLSARHQKIDLIKPHVHDVSANHVPINDRDFKPFYIYMGEFLIVSILVFIFVYILIDANVIGSNIALPFDLL